MYEDLPHIYITKTKTFSYMYEHFKLFSHIYSGFEFFSYMYEHLSAFVLYMYDQSSYMYGNVLAFDLYMYDTFSYMYGAGNKHNRSKFQPNLGPGSYMYFL